MPRPCKVCQHPQQKAVDLALAAGKPANSVSQSFGISVYALQRHRTGHLRPGLVAAAERRDDLSMDGLIEKLRGYLEDAETMMTSARDENDRAGFARLLKEARECVVRLGQLQGAWSEKRQTFVDARKQVVNLSGLSVDELRNLARLAPGTGIDTR